MPTSALPSLSELQPIQVDLYLVHIPFFPLKILYSHSQFSPPLVPLPLLYALTLFSAHFSLDRHPRSLPLNTDNKQYLPHQLYTGKKTVQQKREA